MAKHKKHISNNEGLLGLPTHESRRYLNDGRQQNFFVRTLIQTSALYVLYYILWACPSVPDKDSPQVCHRYHDLKQIVASKVLPQVQPYYEQYAGPYLSKGQPYYEQVNHAYKQYAEPAVRKGISTVRPILERAGSTAQAQYQAKLAPHVVPQYEKLQSQYNRYYQQYVGKHVDTAYSVYDANVAPHVSTAQKKASEAYDFAIPHAQNAANKGTQIYGEHVHPRLLDGFSFVLHFLRTQVYPTVRRFYLLRVEPRINSLSDKYFHFNISRGYTSLDQTTPEDVASSISASILASITTSIETSSTVIAGETISVEATEPVIAKKVQDRINRGIVDDLLSIAENNIIMEGEASKQALIERLEDTLPAMVKKETVLCEDYLTQLESLTVGEVERVERQILSLAKSESNKGRSTDDLTDELRPVFVKAGKKIHAEAVEVKAHIATVLDALKGRIQKSTHAVYNQFKSDAAIQKSKPEEKLRYEIEGVTKKELKRLDALDDRVDKVREELDAIAASALNSYTKELSALLTDTEGKVESLAGGAASKLQTLHSIGPKKITVNDDSDEFGHGYLPVGAMLGAQAIYNQLSTGIYGAPEPTPIESVVLESLQSFVKDVTSQIDLSSVASAASFAASVASEHGQNAASAVSSAVVGIDTDIIASSAAAAASAVSQAAGNAYSVVGDAAASIDVDHVKASVVGAKDYIGEQAADLASSASEAIYGTPQAFTESIASKASEVIYGTETPLYESIASQASEAFDAVTDKASEVIYGDPITPVPIVKHAHKLSEKVFGSEPSTALFESIASVASQAYESVASKASDVVHGTVIESLSASAASLRSSIASEASVSSKSASSLASVASVSAASSASSASSRASASIASAASAASVRAYGEQPVVDIIVDEVKDKYEEVKEKVEEVVEAVRHRVEL